MLKHYLSLAVRNARREPVSAAINVVTLSDEGLSSVSRQYLKGACEEVVVGNLRAGSDVCQAEEVLEADFVYKTKDQDRLRGGGKVEVAGQADPLDDLLAALQASEEVLDATVASSAADTTAPSNSPSRSPWQRIAVTTPPSWQRARISGSLQRAATMRR